MIKIKYANIIKNVFKERLNELEKKIDQLGINMEEFTFDFPSNKVNSVEENLRIIMVKLWPKIKKNKYTQELLQDYLLKLDEIALFAINEDLRFIDAWNNAYETINVIDKKNSISLDFLSLFLPKYRVLIKSFLEEIKDF